MSEERLARLEGTIDKLSDKIDKLTEVLVQQANHNVRIDRAETQIDKLLERQESLTNTVRLLKFLVIIIPTTLAAAYPMIKDFLHIISS